MIQITNLHFAYGKRRVLYDGLHLTLSPGSIYGLLGPNGAGKSTLFRLMAGLLFPKQGTIQVAGHDPAKRRPAFLQDIFLLPEEVYTPAMRIREYVTLNAPFYPRFDHRQFAGYLAEFGLTEDERLNEISYGQKKKVLIGFGLATNTAVLLMDEPTNGLDIPSKAQFRRLVAGATDENRIVVISTHQVRDLEALIDPVIILTEGHQVIQAPMEVIGERLWFGLVPRLEDIQGTIFYAERAVGGYAVVAQPNVAGRAASGRAASGRIDLEWLFNAVQAHPDYMHTLFSDTKTLTHA